jgi:VIT1/CCC1 family predicted Fe2+/Mn2+ transporter
MAQDALAAHDRDVLVYIQYASARPVQAALACAATFAIGAAVPLLSVLTVPKAILVPVVAAVSLTWLAFLGGLAARVGGAPVTIGAIRVTFWGALAMGLTAGVGALFGTLM